MHTDTPEEQCRICGLGPETTPPTATSNRALFDVNGRHSIEPICEEHDDLTVETAVKKAFESGSLMFTIRCIREGVFTEQEATEHLPGTEAKTVREFFELSP